MSKPVDYDPLLLVADSIGKLMEFWGFKRNMGRIWAVLYLEPRVRLPAQELCQRLSMSSGSVSMALKELVDWGVVKKAWVPGERRDFYEAEVSIWKMVSRVFREREMRHIKSAMEAFVDARHSLQNDLDAHDNQDEVNQTRLRFILERLESLEHIARIGHTLLSAMLSGKNVNASPLALFRQPASSPPDSTNES